MGPTNLGDRVSSFFQRINPFDKQGQRLGNVYEGHAAKEAFSNGLLTSQDGGPTLRLAFRNLSAFPLILCWITDTGKLSHFYRLDPHVSSSPHSDPTSNIIEAGDHFEQTNAGHGFCWAHVPEDQIKKIRRKKKLPNLSCIVGGYRGHLPNLRSADDNSPVHLITIDTLSRTELLRRQTQEDPNNEDSEAESCCFGPPGGLRKRQKRNNRFVSTDSIDDMFLPVSSTRIPNKQWTATLQAGQTDPEPWDTSSKVYELKIIGGWPVYLEPNWHCGDETIEDLLADDLREATKRLPLHAVEYLRRNCPIWVNSSIKFGPRSCPTKARGMCYHPDRKWLVDNGLSDRKHKCVELNDGPGYKSDLTDWGPGGVLVHEFSHAYHHRMLPNGYQNKEILQCFNNAMEEGLYDCVRVKGSQGPEAKAYACSNCMEYFAELSAAFLGCTDDSEEYNKWFPFNRAQIKEHDPRAYNMLCRLWKV